MEPVKKRAISYWSRRAEQFAGLRRRELTGIKGHLWNLEMERYLPQDGMLNILDIGTGTGFLAVLLAAKGHQVTGIDLTPEMIAEARRTASRLELSVDFLVMDAEEPDFAPQSFDAIVTRNLTWTLPHLATAYSRWHSLLRPGGILLNFDADYCREKQPDILPPLHAHRDVSSDLMLEYERIKDCLRPTQQPRPQWDIKLLLRAGFRSIQVDTGMWKRLYHDVDEFFNPTPMFTIFAAA